MEAIIAVGVGPQGLHRVVAEVEEALGEHEDEAEEAEGFRSPLHVSGELLSGDDVVAHAQGREGVDWVLMMSTVCLVSGCAG